MPVPVDLDISCRDCGAVFLFSFTIREQEFYASKGFEAHPQRCPDCRRSFKASRNSAFEHSAVCVDCGTETISPFPVRDRDRFLCRDCFVKQGRFSSQRGNSPLYVPAFEVAGIVGPDGRLGIETSAVPSRIAWAVAGVSEELIAQLRDNPSLLRELSPRAFEELVATLERQGYDVRLTQGSHDGGFDVAAAKKDGLGSFLYLVECKRYGEHHKVGVEVVRSLYGTVLMNGANAGVIATTSCFTRGAIEFQSQREYQIQLRDYMNLQEWLGGNRPVSAGA